jgi:putative transposase
MSAEAAIQALQQAWQAFGRPQEIVSDNGRAFTSGYEGGLTPFGALLYEAGVRQRLITPYWPEANGKAEAFIKILKHECLNRPFATGEVLQQALAAFVTYYNYSRLHGSLGYQPPATRYLGAPRLSNHGLAGLPFLLPALLDAFPPAEPLVPPDPQALRRRYALTLVDC